jgi:hypothetical protein
MKYIQHRVNKVADLKMLQPVLGAEIDLRSDVNNPSQIHLSHDAWVKGDSLTDWLETYKDKKITGTIIFNTKEDGLEDEVFRLVKSYQIENYFFLDTAFPTLVKYVNEGKGDRFCCRVSKYETVAMAKTFVGKVPWIWADCFKGEPLPIEVFQQLKNDFKICLVSPELQKMDVETINKFKHLKTELHSVCTKRPDLWE